MVPTEGYKERLEVGGVDLESRRESSMAFFKSASSRELEAAVGAGCC